MYVILCCILAGAIKQHRCIMLHCMITLFIILYMYWYTWASLWVWPWGCLSHLKLELPWWLWGAIAQCMARAPAAKAGGPIGSIPGGCPGFIYLSAGLLMWMGWRICGALVQFGCYQHTYEWKDLWCSLAVISIDMNGTVCGALVQFGCYQHKHNWMNSSIRLSLECGCWIIVFRSI